MAKKSNKKQGGTSSGTGGDLTTKREHPLQAVLLADDLFARKGFRPLSLDRPKVLCPLNNVPILDYAIDFLEGAGVEELFVVCVSDQIEDYVLQRQPQTEGDMQVTVVKDSFFNNAGDALRELDKRNVVQSDPFILMFADAITNIDLTEAIAAHKSRHKKDSAAIMTMVFNPIGNATHTSIRASADDLVVGLDPTAENRILLYDNHDTHKTANLPCSFFLAHSAIELRSDLLDCGIDICSPDLLARFSDNFDYGDIRQEFVANSVAEEEEGLQNRIFAHILLGKQHQRANYAARIHDFSIYSQVSRDMLRRWCYPTVPDHHQHNGYGYSNSSGWGDSGGGALVKSEQPTGRRDVAYTMQRHYLYCETRNGRVRVGRSSHVRGPGMVGMHCRIGEHCQIDGCVIGHFCQVADKCVLKDSHLWDGVEVGEGAVIIQSILADGVVVKPGAVVNRGCVIGSGCVIGTNVVLPPFTRLTLKEEKDDDLGDEWDDDDEDEEGSEEDDDDDEEDDSEKESSDMVDTGDVQHEGMVTDTSVVGPDGKGRVWKPQPDDEDYEDDDEGGFLSLEEKIQSESIGYDGVSLFNKRRQYQEEPDDNFSDNDEVEEGEGELAEEFENYGGAVTFSAYEPVTSSAQTIVGRQKGIDVIKELTAICLEYEVTSPIENLAIELNSFKFSQNATYSDCVIAAMIAILERMNITKDMSDGKMVAEFKKSLDHWAPLLQKMSISMEEEKAIVLALERCAVDDNEMGGVLSTGMSFRFLLQTLHDEEIVSEDAILTWADERKNDGDTPRGRLFRLKPVQDFIDWLQEESEEEEEDDDDDDDDE